MQLARLEHFLVLTHDMVASRRFYTEVLGMTDGFRPDLVFPGYWLYLGDVACIHIAEFDSYMRYADSRNIPVTRPAAGTGPLDHIAFGGHDYAGWIAHLDAHGVSYASDVVPDGGPRQIFLQDPDGLKIELNFMD